MYDPKPKRKENGKTYIDEDHRTIFRHILKTANNGPELKGSISLPRTYNTQADDDYTSCGVYVSHFGQVYITN